MAQNEVLIAIPGLATLGLAGLLVVFVVRGAASGFIGLNSFVGLRTRATKASEAAWRAGHAAAVPLATLGGVLTFLGAGATVAAVLATRSETAVLVGVLGGAGLLLGFTLAATARADRAARATGA